MLDPDLQKLWTEYVAAEKERIRDVKDLYRRVRIGTPVYVR